jgi:K+-transporting ATPase ATPase C chain
MSAQEPIAKSSTSEPSETSARPESISRSAIAPASEPIVKPAIILFSIFTVVTGLAYPALITLVAHVVFPHQAEGSLIQSPLAKPNQVVVLGSHLVGQSFTTPKYFWPRPSATSPAYNAAASSGSNLGPTNPDFLATVAKRAEALRALSKNSSLAARGESEKIPVDMVTASASGLDPDISPAAARIQIERVANARSIGREQVRKLVAEHTKGRDFGLLGDPRVNVLELNLALDQLPEKM